MKKKLQIFVSSTYTDLLSERQAAVEAILRAGHIPAGMELFAAGDKSQLEVIHRWIDESDIFMLILGGRYGSIDPETGKSYTQLEYEYAVQTKKPFFAITLTKAALNHKVQSEGIDVMEQHNTKKLNAFRDTVTSKMCRFVDDEKDIKLAIHEALLEMLRDREFDGWVSGREVGDVEKTLKDVVRLTSENAKLKAQVAKLKAQTASLKAKATDSNTDELRQDLQALESVELTYKEHDQERTLSVVDWFYSFREYFVGGLTNAIGAKRFGMFLYGRVGPHLTMYGLTEQKRVPNAQFNRLATTQKGNSALVMLHKLLTKEGTGSELSTPASPSQGE